MRLASLTSRETSLENKTIEEIYPEHSLALKKAKLMNSKFLTFKPLWEDYDSSTTPTNITEDPPTNYSPQRNTYFVSKYSKGWPTPIHTTLKKLKTPTLSWLRPRMAYKRHRNLGELL